MNALKDILYKVSIESVIGNVERSIAALRYDSRHAGKDDVFIAIKGSTIDGHEYINKAIVQGVTVVVCQDLPLELVNSVTYVVVLNSSQALATMASNYYGNPSENLKLIGITGTNGKTTVATLLYELFKNAGYKVGLISTVKIMVDSKRYPTAHTTPDSLVINAYLNEMSHEGVDFCFMEVSSHGIDQHRIEGLNFTGGVFTNLSHDHLDYHETFSKYRDVKKSFFDRLPSNAFALVNGDDKNSSVMLQNSKANQYYYALKSFADFRCQILENQFRGLLLKINNNEVWVKLIGSFNAYNITAIYGVSKILGLKSSEALRLMSTLNNVDGRFEYFVSDTNITTIIDYAHTPDALKNVLVTINSIRTKNETLITVVGCGGDRDKSKRPKMAHIATSLSTKIIFTSDNPRSENPDQIISEMELGVEAQNFKKFISIPNRNQAIKTACQFAEPNDIILVAGKGHETYQEVNGIKSEFDDYKITEEFLKKLNK